MRDGAEHELPCIMKTVSVSIETYTYVALNVALPIDFLKKTIPLHGTSMSIHLYFFKQWIPAHLDISMKQK